MFNIITRKTLLDYAEKYPIAANALFEWYHNFINKNYKTLNELKQDYPSASIIGDQRVIFNILGNQYRLVVRIVFEFKTVQIKWFGPHSLYDKIDAITIQP